MQVQIRAALLLIASFVACGATVRADQFYVDAVAGDDTNSGRSPGNAWRTLTHAMALPDPPVPGHTIHVAPGVYDTSLGEVFPILVRPRFHLIGTGGSGVTVADGGGTAEPVMELISGPGEVVSVEGFSMTGGNLGVLMSSAGWDMDVTLRDLHIHDISDSGLFIDPLNGEIDVTLDHVRTVANGRGLVARSFAGSGGSTGAFLANDCEFSDNAGLGISLGQGMNFVGERCRINGNHSSGVGAVGALFYGTYVALIDSLVASNDVFGISGSGSFIPAPLRVDLVRCTIFGNGLAPQTPGFGGAIYLSDNAPTDLDSCILWGNLDDFIDPINLPTVNYSNLEFGPLAGLGNFSEDPLFVDGAGGDFRLIYGSPSVDTGNPATIDGTSLDGFERPIDGDLDVIERADQGAFEFASLRLSHEPILGGTLAVETWGPDQAIVELVMARATLVNPVATPFGEFELDRNRVYRWQSVHAAPGPPSVLVRPLPNRPALHGLTLSIQGRVASSNAPRGKAWSNAIQFTLHD